MIQRTKDWITVFRVGFFLAIRQIRGTSKWTSVLVTFIMTLTFLNLVVVSGILVGLIQGATDAFQERYLGEIFISNLKEKSYISRSRDVIAILENMPEVRAFSARYVESGSIEANYKTKLRSSDRGEKAGTSIAGIDPIAEDKATSLKSRVVQGEYLEIDDVDQVVLGALLLKEYLGFDSPSFPVLSDVKIGSRVKVAVGLVSREMTVKGIVRTKVDEIDRRVFMTDRQMRSMAGRDDLNVDEITVRLLPQVSDIAFKEAMLRAGVGDYALVQTQDDAEPKFLKDIKQTFRLLGNVISSIGLLVAVITIFIVIFINAITRRKYIGILKAIGVSKTAIEIAYVCQSVFYAVVGSGIGLLLVFFVIKPFFDVHPINFPFSDGILVAPILSTFIKAGILILATFIAGYVPARMVARQNTLDAIFNR